MSSPTVLLEKLKAFEGREASAAEVGPDPVNQAMIRHWVEAIGDENPVYTDEAAAVLVGLQEVHLVRLVPKCPPMVS